MGAAVDNHHPDRHHDCLISSTKYATGAKLACVLRPMGDPGINPLRGARRARCVVGARPPRFEETRVGHDDDRGSDVSRQGSGKHSPSRVRIGIGRE